MSKYIFTGILLFIVHATSQAQSADSIFTLEVGGLVCRFVYQESQDTIRLKVDTNLAVPAGAYPYDYRDTATMALRRLWVRDSLVTNKIFILQDTSDEGQRIKKDIKADTVFEAHKEAPDFWHTEYSYQTEMSYREFLRFIKRGLVLKNKKKHYRISDWHLWYACGDQDDFIFPGVYKDVLDKARCLKNGGIVFLIPWATDRNLIYIFSPYVIAVRIDIKK